MDFAPVISLARLQRNLSNRPDKPFNCFKPRGKAGTCLWKILIIILTIVSI